MLPRIRLFFNGFSIDLCFAREFSHSSKIWKQEEEILINSYGSVVKHTVRSGYFEFSTKNHQKLV
jgi:hypothetical protein